MISFTRMHGRNMSQPLERENLAESAEMMEKYLIAQLGKSRKSLRMIRGKIHL